jgi:hypothetical protein
MKQKLEDIDSEELLLGEEGVERRISQLDFDVHEPQQQWDSSFSKTINHASCGTVETALMSHSEWCGGGVGFGEEDDSSEDNDEDAQSFADCSPLASGRAYLARGEWLADLMINKDMNDPTYATRWVYSSSEDGSCQHLELDIRVLKENINNNNNNNSNIHYHHSMDIKRAASEGMVGKITHFYLIGGSNPLNLSSSRILDFKRKIQKTRRFSTNSTRSELAR